MPPQKDAPDAPQQIPQKHHTNALHDMASQYVPCPLNTPKEGLFTAHHLSKRYGRRYVLNNVSIEVERGQVVGLLGPNGAGKTTAFSIISGLLTPNRGRITMNGLDITAFPLHKRARLGLGYLPQDRSVFRRLTVEENLMAVLQTTKMRRDERRQKVEEFLEVYHIGQVRDVLGYQLSGGESRRVEIARMLLLEPQFILLDEPFAGVDPIAVLDMQETVRQLKTKGIGILITDHNVRETLNVTDYTYIIYHGQTLVEGKPQDLANNATAKRVYLGEGFDI